MDILQTDNYSKLGNSSKLLELIKSKVLFGFIFTNDFVNFSIRVSDLDYIFIQGEFDFNVDMKSLKEVILGNKKELTLNRLEYLYINCKDEILDILVKLEPYIRFNIEVMKVKQGNLIQTKALDIVRFAQNIGDVVNNTTTGLIGSKEGLIKCLISFLDNSENLLNRQYLDPIKIKVFKYSSDISDEDIISAMNTITNMESISLQYTMGITSLIQLVMSSKPTTKVDPYVQDQYDNLVGLLREPEEILANAKEDRIFSPGLVQALNSNYPLYFELAAKEYLGNVSKYHYPERLIIDKNLGVSSEGLGFFNNKEGQ